MKAMLHCVRGVRTMPFTPSVHVSDQRKDVWSLINEAAAHAEHRLCMPVVNLGQGFFSYSPPAFAIEAARKALGEAQFNQYAPTRGRPELRNIIATMYGELLGRPLDPALNVVVTSGANEGIYSALTAFINHGDEVIVFEPFFDQYIPNIELPGGKPVYVPIHPPKNPVNVSSANDWYINFEELESKITEKTKMLIINSPHNPIGKVFNREELQRIVDLCVKNHIIILSDEVYERLHYTPEFPRVATLSEDAWNHTLSVYSAGKMFAATGWRIGFLVGPKELVVHTANANTRICFSANAPLQHAVAVALDEARSNGYFEQMRTSFMSKIERFVAVFDELGLPYSRPEGGYFVLVDFSSVEIPDDWEIPEDVVDRPRDFHVALWLIDTLGVVAIPPTEFSTEANAPMFEKYLRFAVCKDDALLDEAISRLRNLRAYIE